jgi:hypothetical protein
MKELMAVVVGILIWVAMLTFMISNKLDDIFNVLKEIRDKDD